MQIKNYLQTKSRDVILSIIKKNRQYKQGNVNEES